LLGSASCTLGVNSVAVKVIGQPTTPRAICFRLALPSVILFLFFLQYHTIPYLLHARVASSVIKVFFFGLDRIETRSKLSDLPPFYYSFILLLLLPYVASPHFTAARCCCCCCCTLSRLLNLRLLASPGRQLQLLFTGREHHFCFPPCSRLAHSSQRGNVSDTQTLRLPAFRFVTTTRNSGSLAIHLHRHSPQPTIRQQFCTITTIVLR